MGTQQFCLKWNNHSSNMLNVFETLLTSEQLVDVTLACDGLSLKAHKMVLSACSPFFQSLFQENPCKHPIVILKDIRFADLKAIIDFMYKGEVNVGQAHLSALLKTAETLKVKGLAEVSGEDGQSSNGSVVQQEVPVFPQAQHSSDVANIVQTIDSSIRPTSDSPTGRKRKRTKWKNRGQGGNDSETDDQGPSAKNQEIVSADVIEDDSSSIGVVDVPSENRNAKESRIIIEEATIVGDYVEPAALLEQNMTTDNGQPVTSQLMLTNATSKENDLNVPDNRSYDTTVATMNPETVDLIDRPEDVKPTALVSYEEPPMSPNATSSHHSQDDSNSMTMYMDPNSMPAIAGPSNYQQDKQPSASAGQGFKTAAFREDPTPHPSHKDPFAKPPFSFKSLIGMAIQASANGKLTVQEIYHYITRRFPYYERNYNANFKNNIRKTLSVQKQNFVKQSDCDKSKWLNDHRNHFWSLAPTYDFRTE